MFDIIPTRDTSNELETKRLLLQKLRESRVEGAIIRSRAGWHELGGKNSSYLLNLQKRRNVSRQMNEFIKENGEVCHVRDMFDESGTLMQFHNFKRRYGFDRRVAYKESRGKGESRARRIADKESLGQG